MSDVRAASRLKKCLAWCILGSCLLFLPQGAQAATSDSATLQWTANQEANLAGYRIYRGTNPGVYGVPTTVGKITTHQYTNLLTDKTHYFTVTAFDASGNESLPSPEVKKYIAPSSNSSGSSSPPPPSSLSISNLTVASGSAYSVSAVGLQAGGTVYRDRAYTFTSVPTSVQGAAYIQTANNDKAATTAAFLRFTVNQPVSVTVAYDVRLTPKPSWLSSFTDTGKNLVTSDTTLHLYARAFPAGTITLGGNASGGSGSMYSVIVQPAEGPAPDITPPTTHVLWRNASSGEVAVWRMNGLTITSVGFPGSTSTEWKIKQVGDINGDGEGDILWQNTISGVVGIWLMKEGTIQSFGFPGGVSAEWVVKGIGDINGDGKGDVIWRNKKSGMVTVWFMDGLSIRSVGFLGGTPTVWEIEQVGDINGDGRADLVWQNRTNGTVAVWLLNGLTITAVGFPSSTSLDWEIQLLGDVNGDGKGDVIWRNKKSGMVSVWLMNGVTTPLAGFIGGIPLEWDIRQVSDADGDGKGDVILQNRTNGKVAVWLMDGLKIGSVGFPGSTPVNWEIQK
ncbi:FG-GAP-like repeat-containing protein [Candidatus Nitrospira allomarina]|uniref:FG-GAP-like repeat-containing protein n=1 Tax=Candidatus Nitrospira allomarina TaxID=3020900 RepID=A0AA96GCL5_9BACT|nr:FG-GAP-like repeat-containing protein [Candidatus Nitrospira allomarina]WNM59121.1 FG-GAP-like repeat-containing protein [Candidatus Nitrospira allomarina]